MNSSLVTKEHMVICFFVDRRLNQVLLAKKARKIGKNKYNGYGGKFEGDETPVECAQRECFDECGLTFEPSNATYVAQVLFKNQDSNTENLCEIFIITEWAGEPKESDEMKSPTWFPITNLPFDEMMAGDERWVREVLKLQTQPFIATITLQGNECTEVSILEMDSLM